MPKMAWLKPMEQWITRPSTDVMCLKFKEDHTAIASPEHLVISAAQVQNGEYKMVWSANFAYAEPVAQE